VSKLMRYGKIPFVGLKAYFQSPICGRTRATTTITSRPTGRGYPTHVNSLLVELWKIVEYTDYS
jgi:hypothetical protein